MWIYKDGVRDRGEGVQMISDLDQVDTENKNAIVQQYIQVCAGRLLETPLARSARQRSILELGSSRVVAHRRKSAETSGFVSDQSTLCADHADKAARPVEFSPWVFPVGFPRGFSAGVRRASASDMAAMDPSPVRTIRK